MRVASFFLLLVAAKAVDSSKVLDKPKQPCFLSLLCFEDEEDFNRRAEQNEAHQKQKKEVMKHINELEMEKTSREAAEEAEAKRKKQEREENKKYCGCTFAC